jgi:hypothetical protein
MAQPEKILCDTMERSREEEHSVVQGEDRQCLQYQLPGAVGRLLLGGTMVYRVEKSIWEGYPYSNDYRQHAGRSMDGHSQHKTPRGAMCLTHHEFDGSYQSRIYLGRIYPGGEECLGGCGVTIIGHRGFYVTI